MIDAALVGVALAGCEPAGERRVRASWRVENRTGAPLSLREAWIPHEKFRGARETFEPPRALAPGASLVVEQLVAFDAAVDAGLENSFVVLRFDEGRVFARLRVDVEADGRVVPRVVRVTSGV